MINAFFYFIIGVLVLVAIRYVLQSFSPDGVISKLIDIVLFIGAIYLCWHFLVPLVS